MMVLSTGALVARACPDAEMSRELALALFKDRVLGRMGLKFPPVAPESPLGWKGPGRRPRSASSAAEKDHKQDLDTSQIIVFPSSGKTKLSTNPFIQILRSFYSKDN